MSRVITTQYSPAHTLIERQEKLAAKKLQVKPGLDQAAIVIRSCLIVGYFAHLLLINGKT